MQVTASVFPSAIEEYNSGPSWQYLLGLALNCRDATLIHFVLNVFANCQRYKIYSHLYSLYTHYTRPRHCLHLEVVFTFADA